MLSDASHEFAPAAQLEDYVLDTYDASRTRFRAAGDTLAQRHAGEVVCRAIAVPSQTDDDLTIDTLTLRAVDTPDKLLVVTSGVHGIEGPVGSAIQQMCMVEVLPKLDLSRLTILWVHAVNPWGFRHRRRVTEGNIDLNRNFDPHPTRLFDTTNDAYAELDDFLNPTMPVSLEKVDQAMAEVYARASNIPRSRLRQAILQGQYQFPEGMYFGGRAFAPQKQPLEALLKEHIAEHQAVLTLDLHTGFGRRGHMHLFGAPGLGDPEAMAAVFDGYTIDTGANNEDFYETTGDFIVYAGELSAGKTALGVTLEYGTLDSQTELGAAQSLVNMRLENQGFHHGYLDEAARDQAQAQFMEMFNPSDPAWRRTILDTTRSALPVWLERFVALP